MMASLRTNFSWRRTLEHRGANGLSDPDPCPCPSIEHTVVWHQHQATPVRARSCALSLSVHIPTPPCVHWRLHQSVTSPNWRRPTSVRHLTGLLDTREASPQLVQQFRPPNWSHSFLAASIVGGCTVAECAYCSNMIAVSSTSSVDQVTTFAVHRLSDVLTVRSELRLLSHKRDSISRQGHLESAHWPLCVQCSRLRNKFSQTLRFPPCLGRMFVQDVASSLDLLTVTLRCLIQSSHLRTPNDQCTFVLLHHFNNWGRLRCWDRWLNLVWNVPRTHLVHVPNLRGHKHPPCRQVCVPVFHHVCFECIPICHLITHFMMLWHRNIYLSALMN